MGTDGEDVMASRELIAQGKARRQEILTYIAEHTTEHGFAPSVAEIADTVGINKTAVRHHLGILVDEGVITIAPGKNRSIRILGRPA
jgi:SOS-response transcriptional repressor LexA